MGGVSLTEIPLDRDPPLNRDPSHPLNRNPPDRDPPGKRPSAGQRPPPRQRPPEIPWKEHGARDRDPPRRNMGPGSETGSDFIQRPPPSHEQND